MPSGSSPQNIILIIGDGMGPQQVSLAFAHERFSRHKHAGISALTRFFASSLIGMHIPFTDNHLVNDSACSATQLGSGCACEPQQVGMDSRSVPCENAAEAAHKMGMRTAAISDTRLTHATPASFGVHEEHRGHEDSIAWKLSNSSLDIMLSGGLAYFAPSSGSLGEKPLCGRTTVASKRKDALNPLENAMKRGFNVVCDEEGLEEGSLPLLGLFAERDMGDAFHEGRDGEPTLVEMSERALTLLDNPKGFFMMVEAGQIDWAGHANDAGWLLAEMKRLGNLLSAIEDFTKRHPDTLVLLTGDHETGGFGFSYKDSTVGGESSGRAKETKLDFAPAGLIDVLDSSSMSLKDIMKQFSSLPQVDRTPGKLREMVFTGTGQRLSPQDAQAILDTPLERSPFYPYSDYLPSARLASRLAPHTNIAWSTGTHTSTPIPIFAAGPGGERFRGVMTSKEFGEQLLQIVKRR
jgi:alkaline phosphatase